MANTRGPQAAWRKRLHEFVWSKAFQNTIIVVILVNAVIIGVETAVPHDGAFYAVLVVLDKICIAIFVVEIVLKLAADGWRFFRSGWHIFDFVIVVSALIPGADGMSVLRALRVLRVLRLISVVPALRRVVDGLGRAIPGLASVGALLAIVFYIGAVMSTTLYGASFPEQFGDLAASTFTLFQLTTLDNWSIVTREVSAVYPLAPWFFVTFVLISALTVLNLMVAVIVDAMQSFGKGEQPAAGNDELADEVRALRAQVQELTDALRKE